MLVAGFNSAGSDGEGLEESKITVVLHGASCYTSVLARGLTRTRRDHQYTIAPVMAMQEFAIYPA